MNPEEEALRVTLDLLDRIGIPYMVTGSVAASYHGRPRTTHDADLVIDPSPDQLSAFVHALASAGFYVNDDGARKALRARGQFNAIETRSAAKIDLIVRKDRPYSLEEFERRQRVDLAFAQNVAIVAPEDAILSKLEWARRSGESERQLRDVAGILELNPNLDRDYISRWSGALGIVDLWRRVSEPDRSP